MMKFAACMLVAMAAGQADFRSGSVSTYEKFRYGKFVTRMKAPDRKGTVSSFFTYWDGPNFDPLEWNELDLEIVPSVEENPFSMNIIYGDGHDKVESHDYGHEFNPHDDWHTYEMEWTPHYIAWIVDGHEIRHVNTQDPAVKNLDKPQSLRMNFWTPTFHSWSSGFNPVDMPWYVLYDYVEVFTYDEEHNEFKFHWRDDFDSFDSGKWHKAAGGFESNTSVFHPENVFTSGGHLILKMEPEHTHAVDYQVEHEIHEAFDMHLDRADKHHDHEEPRVNDFDSDSSSSSSSSSDHHPDYYHDDHHSDHSGDYYHGDHHSERSGDYTHSDRHSDYYHDDHHSGDDYYQEDRHGGYHEDHHGDYHEEHHGDFYEEDHRLGPVHHDRHHYHDEHEYYPEDPDYHGRYHEERGTDHRLGYAHPSSGHHDERKVHTKYYEPSEYDQHYHLPARHEEPEYYDYSHD